MYPYIVADIGGTNARFALVTGKTDTDFKIEQISILPGANFASFEEAIQNYLDSLGDIQPTAASIAIAGPVDGDQFKMTNLSWSFSREGLKTRFGFEKLEVINDYTALAMSSSILTKAHLIELKAGDLNPTANKAILGPGTGLGVAGLVYTPAGWVPVPSEGGHVNIAPSTAFEAEIIKAAMSTLGHVSAESFLSGQGLVNLYDAVCAVTGVSAQTYQPQDVSGKALEGSDGECVQALERFCSFLGAVSGNLALTYGAKGGVYVAGGIVPRMLDFIKGSEFNMRFASKGIMSHYVEPIPVNIFDHPETAFLGAAAWLEQQ